MVKFFSSDVDVGPVPEVRHDSIGRKIYQPDGINLAAFLIDRSPVSIIRGPWGSGTSVACCQKLWQLMCEQKRRPDGRLSRTRFIIVRDTYPQLETTAMETWLEWFPEDVYGKLYTGKKPYIQKIRTEWAECDLYFYAMEEGSTKLLSLEPTGGWFNELEKIPLELFAKFVRRTGRYPRAIDGGATWSGAIADMNAPPANHWVPIMFGEAPIPEDMHPDEAQQFARPPDWAYFTQPAALIEVRAPNGELEGYRLNPEAENLRFVRPEYYQKQIYGTPKREIDANILNKILPLVDGERVHVDYNPDVHEAKSPLPIVDNYPVRIGVDFGRRPAAVFGQFINNRWMIQREIYARDAGATKFAPAIKRVLAENYPQHEIIIHGDPKGADKTQADERTAYDVFRTHQLNVRPAPVKQNHIQTRLDTVDSVLNAAPGGLPKMQIDPSCTLLKSAMAGGYRWPKDRPMVGEDRKPIKDRYSDICDALQYLLIGGGELREITGRGVEAHGKPVQVHKQRSKRRVRA